MSKTPIEIALEAQQEFEKKYARPTDGGDAMQYWRGQMQAFIDGAAWQSGRAATSQPVADDPYAGQPKSLISREQLFCAAEKAGFVRVKTCCEGVKLKVCSYDEWRGDLGALSAEIIRTAIQPAIKEFLTTVQPAAEVVPKYGDPEEFGERDITLLVDIQKLPYGTKFYTAPVPQASWQQAYEDLRRLIADDAYAISFQSMGQYRSALLKSQKDAAISQKENGK